MLIPTLGVVTRILVLDNLKTGVIKNTRTELILNRSYYEMAEHYGAAIIPARPIKPKDKPTAEGTVKSDRDMDSCCSS
ncbi:hypothetical protein bsdcttw_45140 [Anaerocolumna chitinilytica]|uniref:Transposase n=1 Tax=Anaerocolumna chitinilytica TaxID=1727145 RepID=A0A7M3SA56_9FIRM|nr:hypothetical protein bsdcttw_45140 [Anaerocolumna chitinilytica]